MFTIKHPITGSKLNVAESDFPTEMKLEEAKKACAALGRGWRLPTMLEWETIANHLINKGDGNFEFGHYASKDEIDEDSYHSVYVDPTPGDDISFLKPKKSKQIHSRKIRAVKS